MISEDLVRRVRGEFYEMPGLRLTFAQACRLWQLDERTCAAILDRLVGERVLHRSTDGRSWRSLLRDRFGQLPNASRRRSSDLLLLRNLGHPRGQCAGTVAGLARQR